MASTRLTGAIAGALALALLLPGAPAVADATNPQWRVTGVLPDDAPAFKVDASGPANAWVVGPHIAVSFNGEQWSDVEDADGGQTIHDVSTNRTDNTWLLTTGTDTTHLIRFRHGARSRMPVPGGTWVDAIQATGRDATWVAGRDGGNQFDKGTGTPYLRRFDGASWTSYPIPAGAVLNGFAARSDDDVWAFGHTRQSVPPTGPSQPVALHWDGQRWTAAAVPGLPAGAALVRGAIINSKSAWATGYEWDIDDTGRPVWGQPVTYRYAGGAWQQVVVPDWGGADHVASDGAGNAWLGRYDSGTLLRFGNGTWQSFPLPTYLGSQVTPQDMALIPGTKTTIMTGLVPGPIPPEVRTVILAD